MNKTQYFEKSANLKLPPRCPLLNTCQRCAYTVYLFSFYKEVSPGFGTWEDLLRNHGQLSEKYFTEKIEIQGESPDIMKGRHYWNFNRACPEINLFEDSIIHFPNERLACTSASWDNERTKDKLSTSEYQHYSECAEFSYHSYNKKPTKMTNTKTRTKIPKEAKVRAELQKEINSNCPFCTNDDVGHFEIHHIDENPSNHEMANLMLLCRNCHSKITKGDIVQSEVFKKKIYLLTSPKAEPKLKGKTINLSNINNAVVGDKNRITINNSNKKVIQKYPPGCLGYDTNKANYIGHLIKRYHEYKEYDAEKMNYAMFPAHLKKHFNIATNRTIYNLPEEKFEDLYLYIQSRIDGTKLAKIKGRQHKNYSSFEEFLQK